MYTIANVSKQSNLMLAYTRLLTNPENTYKNFFCDTYSIYGMASEKNIALLQKRVKTGYLPAQSIRVFMPKANGLNRMYTLLSIEDQIVYQAYSMISMILAGSLLEATIQFFLLSYLDDYKKDSKHHWVVGDRDVDISKVREKLTQALSSKSTFYLNLLLQFVKIK